MTAVGSCTSRSQAIRPLSGSHCNSCGSSPGMRLRVFCCASATEKLGKVLRETAALALRKCCVLRAHLGRMRKPMPRRSIAQTGVAKPQPLFALFAVAGSRCMAPLCDNWKRDLPHLPSFSAFRGICGGSTTNIIEHCFVEVRRRTRPMVCFVNVKASTASFTPSSRDSTWKWKNRTLRVLHKQLDVT